MEREAEQECCRKHCSDPMPRNVDQSMERKEERGDERGKPVALIGSLPQRKHFPDNEDKSDDNKNYRDPTQFGPSPQPIAFRMMSALIGQGGCAERCED